MSALHPRRALAAAGAALLLAPACRDDGSAPRATLRVEPSSPSLTVGGVLAVAARVDGARPAGATVTWRLVPESVATVVRADGDAAVLRGLRTGEAALTASLVDRGRALDVETVPLRVARGPCNLTGPSVTPATMTLEVGARGRLTVLPAPCDPPDVRYGFQSRDTAIATVDSLGVVTARAPGVATLLVLAADGRTAAGATVTVVPAAARLADASGRGAQGASRAGGPPQ